MDETREPGAEADTAGTAEGADRGAPQGRQMEKEPTRPSRASMREELLALFRDTEREAAGELEMPESMPTSPEEVPQAPAADEASPTPPQQQPAAEPAPPSPADATSAGVIAAPGRPPSRPSSYLRRFLRRARHAHDPVPSGLPALDTLLDGGFGPGLHLVTGHLAAVRTALVLSFAWESVSAQRPVVYYAFREGALGAWVRLMTTLAGILGHPDSPAAVLRTGRIDNAGLDLLLRLDQVLQTSILPRLSLVESIPARIPSLDAFFEDVEGRVRETRERAGSAPLVLVDDLDRLLLLSPNQGLEHTVALIEGRLTDKGLAAVISAGAADAGSQELPARNILVVRSGLDWTAEGLAHMTLEVKSGAALDSVMGSTQERTLPLLLDLVSGLFTEDDPGQQRASPK